MSLAARAIERRSFLRAAGGAFLLGLMPGARAAAEEAEILFASAFRRADGGHGVAVLAENGTVLSAIPLPDRGHDIVFDRVSSRAVAFARQPGTFALVFDPAGRAPSQTIASEPGRHFFGHGVFSPDGRLLYATENDFEAARGLIGVYDVGAGFRRIGEFPTGGIGPHECLLLDDGKTLAVANGGIETHPDFGREELNLATMRPSLAFIDRESGTILESHVLPRTLHQLSIRHMDLDSSGTLWFGCQHRGPLSERPPLVGRARRGEGLSLVSLADEALLPMQNYVGSVAVNREAGLVAVSSPEGNAWLTLRADTGALVEHRAMNEVCGLAADRSGFLVTTGLGDVVADGKPHAVPDHAWDNHILRFSA